jgi:hypothetical protein
MPAASKSNPEKESTPQRRDSANGRVAVRILLSVLVLAAGFAFLLFGSGDPSDTGLAAGGIGMILGHWLR